jgi:hypothetical protein
VFVQGMQHVNRCALHHRALAHHAVHCPALGATFDWQVLLRPHAALTNCSCTSLVFGLFVSLVTQHET